MRGRLYAVLITLFTIPFLLGGIVCGFRLGEALQQSGVLGLSANSWAGIAVDLCLAALGIYLSGLVAYVILLAGATTFFSRETLEHFASDLPQGTRSGSNVFRAPFTAIGNFFWARAR